MAGLGEKPIPARFASPLPLQKRLYWHGIAGGEDVRSRHGRHRCRQGPVPEPSRRPDVENHPVFRLKRWMPCDLVRPRTDSHRGP